MVDEKNIGMPAKGIIGKNFDYKDSYIYGRYYGVDANDKTSAIMVTPYGTVAKLSRFRIKLIDNQDDLNKLKYFENKEEKPYDKILIKDTDEKYHKNTLNNIEAFDYDKYNDEHYMRYGYFDEYFNIDANLFGDALSCIMSKKYGVRYYFQEIKAIYETKTNRVYFNERHTRNMLILSPIQYKDNYLHDIRENPFPKGNPFEEKPIQIKNDELLLYFGVNYNHLKNIKLGSLKDGKFVPNNHIPIRDISHIYEVKYNNQKFKFINDFIMTIMDYKIKNRKPNLDKTDMAIILKNMGIIDIKEELRKLVTVLNGAKDKSINILIENNSLEKTLKMKK